MKIARPYQVDLDVRLLAAWERGSRRLLLVLAPGGGKTLQVSLLAHRTYQNGRRSLFLAHREELIRQAKDTFIESGIPERSIGTILSGYVQNYTAPTQIGSIQTLSRRDYPKNIDLVFVDEAHRSQGPQYIKVIEHYIAQGATIIGMTGTPIRLDGKPMAPMFQEIVMGPPAAELAKLGYLATPRIIGAKAPDLEGIKLVDGDFEEKEVAKRAMRPEIIGQIVPEYERWGGGHRAFCFVCNLEHARLVLDAFIKGGHRAAILSAETGREERRRLLDAIREGSLRVLISVGVLLEGVDCPPVKVIIWARPTESLTVYIQGTSRGLRPWEDVTPVIIDHATNVDRLKHPFYPHQWSLEGPPRRKAGEPDLLMKECPECGAQLVIQAGECECGFVFREQAGPPQETTEELVEKTDDLIITDEKASLLKKLKESFIRNWLIAKKSGFAVGFVYMKTHEETGMTLPKNWMASVEKDYTADLEWKRKFGIRIAMNRRRARARASGGGSG